MKQSLLVALTLVVGSVTVATTNAAISWAGVGERIYAEGGVIMPSGGSIDNSRVNQSLRDANSIRFSGEVELKGQTGYTALIGYELVQWSYTFSIEFQTPGT